MINTPNLTSHEPAHTTAKDLIAIIESTSGPIDFPSVAEFVLGYADAILEHWLPDGAYQSNEYVALNPLRDDCELGSFKINTKTGFWADFAGDEHERGRDLISLIAMLDTTSNAQAAIRLLKFVEQVENTGPTTKMKKQFVARAGTVAASEEATLCMPVPLGAAERPASFLNLGQPTKSWRYASGKGETMFYVDRFDAGGGKKEIRPLTYWIDSTGAGSWRQKAPTGPRPAYGLDKLATHPAAPVLFTEGEKAADAAQRLFPSFVAVTTHGGAMASDKTDFTPFKGRQVYIAPDHDEPGMEYARKLLSALRAVGARPKGMLNNSLLARAGTELVKGFDLADAEQIGWTPTELASLGVSVWLPVADEPSLAKVTGGKKNESLQELATRFAASHFSEGLAFTQNQFRAYRGGYWPALDRKVDMEKELYNLLGRDANPGIIGSCITLLSTAHAELDIRFSEPKPLVCLLNGTLDPIAGKLLQHQKEHMLTNRLDVTWDENANCSLWLQTLDEIFAPDSDKAEKIALLQEYMGYCLVPMTHMHKFLWLVGGGGNGKSLVLNVITSMIGRENISFAQIERIQCNFVRAELCGKLVNISSEMSSQATVADGYLKQIVSGDVIEAERKHQPSFSFKPYCRMIGATNELPRLLDSTNGFFRRAIILQFNRQFTEAEQDRTREQRVLAELPGILRWAVDGLRRLLSSNQFTLPPSSSTEIAKYQLNSDSIRQFVEECLQASEISSDFVTSARLHEYYQQWCKGYGYQACAQNKLSTRLTGLGLESKRLSKGQFGKSGTRHPYSMSH